MVRGAKGSNIKKSEIKNMTEIKCTLFSTKKLFVRNLSNYLLKYHSILHDKYISFNLFVHIFLVLYEIIWYLLF